ncbi:MAG: hypothetical protein RMK97_01850, partial [Sutterellaceae bacterium]|nr:hypothetical protein [Burkholderiaceae bacterium]MDW8429237.1 hypothetical protein [Sutterellaceae bacterium]
PEGEIPCNALALLLAGAALAGASPRARASVRVDPSGVPLQEAVEGFLRLRSDPVPSGVGPLGVARVR